MYQAACDFNPAAHTTGERLDLRVAPFDEINSFENIRDIFLSFLMGNAIKLGIDAEIFLDCEVLVAGQGLGNDADHAADRVRLLGHIVAGDEGAAGGERNQRGHHADEGAFTRAVGAEKTEYFTLSYREADILDGLEVAITLDAMNYFDCRWCCVRWRAHCFTSLFLGI